MTVTVQLTVESLASKHVWKRSHNASHSDALNYGPLNSISQTKDGPTNRRQFKMFNLPEEGT